MNRFQQMSRYLVDQISRNAGTRSQVDATLERSPDCWDDELDYDSNLSNILYWLQESKRQLDGR